MRMIDADKLKREHPVDNTLAGETVWQMIVDRWQEDNGDEWWREEQNNEDD